MVDELLDLARLTSLMGSAAFDMLLERSTSEYRLTAYLSTLLLRL